MAARLHAVFASYSAIQDEPWKQPFYLLGTDLIKTLKVHNSNKFTKSQKLKAIADLAWVVGTLGAVIHWFEGDMDLCVRERSLLWVVSVQEYTQPNVNDETEELHEVVIRVQPGLWTHNFLNREGAQQQKALYQYGLVHFISSLRGLLRNASWTRESLRFPTLCNYLADRSMIVGGIERGLCNDYAREVRASTGGWPVALDSGASRARRATVFCNVAQGCETAGMAG